MSDIKDTRDLQLFSVTQAMATLGYHLMVTNRGGKVFYNPYKRKTGDALVSIRRAIFMHNSPQEILEHDYDIYSVKQFVSAKVVRKAKLQYSKKKKTIYVNGVDSAHYVLFLEPEYSELFGVEQLLHTGY
jgi:hypothetical protein